MYSRRQLTEHLRRLSMEAHTISDSGEAMTKAEALADLLWKKCLGYIENIRNSNGEWGEVRHTPEAWAIQLVYDRMEGKTAPPSDKGVEAVPIHEQVSELAKARLNGLAMKTTKKTEISEARQQPKKPPPIKKESHANDETER